VSQELQGHGAVHAHLVSAIDQAHAALGNRLEKAESRDLDGEIGDVFVQRTIHHEGHEGQEEQTRISITFLFVLRVLRVLCGEPSMTIPAISWTRATQRFAE
jgi:hypothetical protein